MFRLVCVSLALCAVVLPGPAAAADDRVKPDTLEAISRDAVDLQNELTAILEKVKNKEDLEKARDKIEKLRLAIERLRIRVEKLVSEPSPEKLLANLAVASEKNQGAAAEAEERYQAAVRKLPADTREALQASLGGGSIELMMLDFIRHMSETSEILEAIKTKADAEKAQPRLVAANRRMKEVMERAQSLMRGKEGKGDERAREEMRKLEQKYAPRFEQSMERYQRALRALPEEVRDAIDEDALLFGGSKDKKPAKEKPVREKPAVDIRPPKESKPPVDIKPPKDVLPPKDNAPPKELKPPVDSKPPKDVKPPSKDTIKDAKFDSKDAPKDKPSDRRDKRD